MCYINRRFFMTKQEKIKTIRLFVILGKNIIMYQTIFDLHRQFIDHWLIKLLFPKRYYNLLIEVYTELNKDVQKLEELKQLINELNLNE